MCVCVYMCVYICICIYVYMYIYICEYVYICVNIYVLLFESGMRNTLIRGGVENTLKDQSSYSYLAGVSSDFKGI